MQRIIEKSGEHIFDGAGEPHLEICQKDQARLRCDRVLANYELDESSSKKAFLNLFGNGDDAMEKEFETESEEEEDAEVGYLTINTNNFQCAECEFPTRFPNHMKEPTLNEHGQQRARIYSCPMTKDNKGKSKESEADPKPKEPKAQTETPKVPETQTQKQKPKEVQPKAKKPEAVTESKSKKKPTEVETEKEKVVSQEKSGDTQDPKVALLKPKDMSIESEEKTVLSQEKAVEHHVLHSDGAEVGKYSKRKILQEEDEEVDIEGSFQKEEKIIKIIKVAQSKVGGLMSAPLSPVKKAKKGKTSPLDVSGVTTNGESPAKRKKHVKSEDTSSISDVSQLSTVNKKARLESVGDSTTDESALSCDQCGKSVGSRQRPDSHIQKKHISQLKSSKCQDVFIKLLHYVSHFWDCLTDNGFFCGVDKCTKVFKFF
ncbi:zinc finger protein CG2199-like [Drosophila subpulchrella]|uniref:zinc finger protein CG2199-like n=1 Tax=Drosophila subpulchrella TaxID=1486046 RepID=UPI0018A162B9|nr:zinc finger protein CG2199-like [Drosophila subpulchrella]